MKVYVFDGLIGAGKTTLITELCSYYRERGFKCVSVLEPVETWRESGMLGWFYQDPAANAYAFQTYVYTTRIQAIVSAFEAEPLADMYLLERSPETDRLFMEMLRSAVSPALFAAYESWRKLHEKLLPFDLKKAIHVYLRPPLDLCMQRISKRGRGEESSVTHGYQQELMHVHDRWYSHGAPEGYEHITPTTSPKLVLETAADFREKKTLAHLGDMIAAL